jgi:hypothetical protein
MKEGSMAFLEVPILTKHIILAIDMIAVVVNM